MTDHTCKACQRIYSSKGNLDKHVRISVVCRSWLDEIGNKAEKWYDSPNLYDLIQYRNVKIDDLLKDLIPSVDGESCKYCRKHFASKNALQKHMRSSVICDRWRQHDLLANAQRLLSDRAYDDGMIQSKISSCADDSCGNYAIFDPPKYAICHIIWNVFLVDKEFINKVNFEEVCHENNIKYIIGIVPHNKIFEETVSFEIDNSQMLYSGHTTDLDVNVFDEECAKIESYRANRDNVMIFCNNGYQRSLGFIVYYLFKHHHNEVPTIDRALDIILPQVDKGNYSLIRDKTIESITKLFKDNQII